VGQTLRLDYIIFSRPECWIDPSSCCLPLDQTSLGIGGAQLDIIRSLVEARADPSALSSEGIPIWMVDKNHFYRTEPCLVSNEAWCSPRAVALLIQLGMSVTQRCPAGRTLLHFVAGPALIDDPEVFNLIFGEGRGSDCYG